VLARRLAAEVRRSSTVLSFQRMRESRGQDSGGQLVGGFVGCWIPACAGMTNSVSFAAALNSHEFSYFYFVTVPLVVSTGESRAVLAGVGWPTKPLFAGGVASVGVCAGCGCEYMTCGGCALYICCCGCAP